MGHITTKLQFGHQKRLHQNLGHSCFHPLPPDQNVLIFNYKKLGFQLDPLPPFRTMSLNILFFFETFPNAMHTAEQSVPGWQMIEIYIP